MNTRQTQSIEKLVGDIHEVNQQIADLQSRLDELKSTLMTKLEDNELETLVVGEEGDETRITIVRPTTLKIDEAGLESALTKPQWKLVTKQVVDKKALEDAVVRGKIDPTVVANHSKEVATKPYLRITG